MLFGIPYVHGQTTINYVHKDPIYFNSSRFHKDKLTATYMENIFLVGGCNMWQRTDFIKPLPPFLRRMLGRPKVTRRKHALESQDTKYPT